MTLKLMIKLCNKLLGEEKTNKILDECINEIKKKSNRRKGDL